MKKIVVLEWWIISDKPVSSITRSQAIKAYKEENIRRVLINPINDSDGQGIGGQGVISSVTPEFVAEVIKKERPDGIALSFGGQTALNCGVEFSREEFSTSTVVRSWGRHDHQDGGSSVSTTRWTRSLSPLQIPLL